MGSVESVKAASDIYTPVSGQIEQVNEELIEQASLLNKDPMGKGASRIKFSSIALGRSPLVQLVGSDVFEGLLPPFHHFLERYIHPPFPDMISRHKG